MCRSWKGSHVLFSCSRVLITWQWVPLAIKFVHMKSRQLLTSFKVESVQFKYRNPICQGHVKMQVCLHQMFSRSHSPASWQTEVEWELENGLNNNMRISKLLIWSLMGGGRECHLMSCSHPWMLTHPYNLCVSPSLTHIHRGYAC